MLLQPQQTKRLIFRTLRRVTNQYFVGLVCNCFFTPNGGLSSIRGVISILHPMENTMTKRKQRFLSFFNKARKEAIADIFEKIGTALLIAAIISPILSDKGTLTEAGLIAAGSIISIAYSVYLRAEKKEDES